jgi:hypothetical protein
MALGNLADVFSAPTVAPLPDYGAQAAQSVAAAQQAYASRPHGLGNILGRIGDALLQANGIAPIHQAELDRQQTQTALQGFLQDPNAAIQALMQVNAPEGIKLYTALHPPSETPEGVKEFNYYNSLPPEQKPGFEKFLQLTHPGMMAPLTLDRDATVQMPSSIPQVMDQKSYDAVPVGSQYLTPDGHIRVKGGATASPSRTFP